MGEPKYPITDYERTGKYAPGEPTKETAGLYEVQASAPWGFAPVHFSLYVDKDRCIGCFSCETACKAEKGLLAGPRLIRVMQLGPHKVGKHLRGYFLPMTCMHCGSPPCVPACPEKAISKLANGIVVIDDAKCTGCKKCIEACPFAAPQLDTTTGKVIKCDYCLNRIEKGLMPACVVRCPAKAMYFGDINEISTLIREKRARGVAIGLLKAPTYSGPATVWPERLKYLPPERQPLKEAASPLMAST
jgi:Fe-S-cluster-containing dehydrogenase component